MSKNILKICHLCAEVDGNSILKDLDLSVNAGEIHAIMGPNGSGKSTLSKVIAGHPAYKVIRGSVLFNGQDIIQDSPEDRACKGIFLAFQYPVEIPGVSNVDFLQMALNSQRKAKNLKQLNPLEFFDLVNQKLKMIGVDPSFLNRNVNEGFSGGQKKQNEILQMAVLDNQLSVLDETDSGLDIDALKTIAGGINQLANPNNAIILITHYQRLLQYVVPDFVHVMYDGRIIKTGDYNLAIELEKYGYQWIKDPSH